MKSKKSLFWVAGISGAVGGGFGAVSGNPSWLVSGVVGAVIAFLVAWGISGMFR